MKEKINAYNNWKCIHCGLVFRTRKLMREHIKMNHKDLDKSKFAGDHSIIPTKCKFCDQVFTQSSGLTRHQNCCKNNPDRIKYKGHLISEEVKQKISNKLKVYYSGSTCWATVRENRKSYAEQYFDNCFPEAKQNYHVGRYWLDLAWPDRKCYVEIDGEQHYTEKGLQHDKERTEFLNNLGWILIDRIRWSNFQKLSQIEKENYVQWVGALVVARRPHKSDDRYGSIPTPARLSELEKLKEDRWNIIQSSNIDFSKFGWVGQISKLFGISPNKAGSYIKRNYPDFYNKCYQRN